MPKKIKRKIMYMETNDETVLTMYLLIIAQSRWRIATRMLTGFMIVPLPPDNLEKRLLEVSLLVGDFIDNSTSVTQDVYQCVDIIVFEEIDSDFCPSSVPGYSRSFKSRCQSFL